MTTLGGNERDLLKESLLKIRELRAELAQRDAARHEPIAIVGAACRFPGGADSLETFWDLLRDGRDAIVDVPSGRWDVARYYDPDPDAAGRSYLRSGGFLDNVEHFDADFFGITPREALRMDPQQRLLLEVAWQALEHAAIAPDSLRGSATGVYVGLMGADYAFRQAHQLPQGEIDPYMLAGNDPSFAAGRLAYVLGLHGPTMVSETACSSSLVSIHLACQALRLGECDRAIAGGVNVILDPVTNVMLSRLRALAPDGRCKTFDASADGYGRGEGCGLLVLARLSDAVKAGHRVLAVIRGSAVNHDGPSAGLTVPNGSAQEKVLRRALLSAGVEPADVSYVEAHGTGTPLGDPCELRALSAVLGGGRKSPLAVGSVKTNIGHLEAAAGIAGLLKVVLSLQHRAIPAHLNLRTPNPHVPWRDLSIRVPLTTEPWTGGRRVAGVSSFGLSGVNAHVVLEEAPEQWSAATVRPAAHDDRERVLPLSAKTPEALAALITAYDAVLAGDPRDWASICFTAACGRAHFDHRVAVVARSAGEARVRLRDATRVHVRINDAAPVRIFEAETAATAYLRGAALDWTGLFQRDDRPVAVDLPTYPFQRRRFWALDTEVAANPSPASEVRGGHSRAADFASAVRTVMGLAADAPIDTDLSLLELGLDSLMAVELRTWAIEALGRDLPLGDLLSGRPLRELLDAFEPAVVRHDPAPLSEPGHDRFALSYGQRALWFIQQSAPASAAYNVGIALRVKSAIRAAHLERAFQYVVDSHPSLRARFPSVDGEPLHVIEPVLRLKMAQHDVARYSDAELRARVDADYRIPFDLATGPMLRVSLYTRAADDHVLLVTIHHIACDATSCWTVLEQVQRTYAELLDGGTSSALPPSATFAAYVEWQRGMLAGEEGERLWTYWRERLSGDLPALDLPTDRPRPAVQTFNGGSVRLSLPPQLTNRLRAFSRAHGATLFATLLAGFHALLHRLTSQPDVIVGSAAFARPNGFEGTVGYFVNPLAIRADLAADPSFADLVKQVRAHVIDALAHQQLPFPLLVERLQPRRDPARSPIFQADFALSRPAPVYRPQLKELATLDVERFELPEEEGQFDIGLHLQDDADTVGGSLKFNADLFDTSTAERIGRCWISLLESAVADPEQPVSRLRLLDDVERAHVLSLGCGAVRPLPDITLADLFERQVRLDPDAPAVREWSPDEPARTVTYAELNRRANRIAHALRERGIGTDALVAVSMPGGSDMVAALLGVLKCGAAYLPLDLSYPAVRRQMILDDATPAMVLTAEALSSFDLDTFAATDLPRTTSPEATAYCIYTSGSTGTPKGTLITHRGLANYLLWALDAYRVTEGSGAPVTTSIGFDATVTSLWLPLVAGRTVVLLPHDRTVEALCDLLATGPDFSLLKITPAHLEVLNQLLPAAAYRKAARALVIGGDVLRTESLVRWQQLAPGTRLINEYGPTETVVGCSIYEVTGHGTAALPIGRPIANTQLLVLDAHGEPVPVGVTGEIYIGGAGVATGYLRRPELTREKFLSECPGAAGHRLYRTGDLGRWRADGELEFLGRVDDQVKIRGYRIELGEIESTLLQHAAVNEVAVVAKTAASGDRHLVAYVTVADGITAADVARHAAERLPEYMRPSRVVIVSALPLTPHGKVDRAALPDADHPRATTFTPPRDPVEARLAALWEDVLGTPAGVRDDFFELGGHSLLVVKLMARIRDAFSVDLALSEILRAPTIEHLANLVRSHADHAPLTVVPLKPGTQGTPFFCVPGAGGNALYLYNLARQLAGDQPMYGLQASTAHASVEAMASDYVRAIRDVQPSGPYAIGGHSLGAWVAFEMVQQLLRAGEAVAMLAVIDTPVPHPAAFRDTSDWDHARWVCELADRIARLLDPSLALSLDDMRRLPEREQLAAFRAVLDRLNLFPGAAGERHLERIVELFKAHSRMRYALPASIAPVPVTLLRTAEPPPHLAAIVTADDWGWSAAGPVDVHVLPGDHLAVLRPPYVAALAERLGRSLDRAAQQFSCPQPSF